MEDLEEELPVVRRLEKELEPGERNLAGLGLYRLIDGLEERIDLFSVPCREEEPFLFKAFPAEEGLVRVLLTPEERTRLDGYFLIRERELSPLVELLDTAPEFFERVIFDEDLLEVEPRRLELRLEVRTPDRRAVLERLTAADRLRDSERTTPVPEDLLLETVERSALLETKLLFTDRAEDLLSTRVAFVFTTWLVLIAFLTCG